MQNSTCFPLDLHPIEYLANIVIFKMKAERIRRLIDGFADCDDGLLYF